MGKSTIVTTVSLTALLTVCGCSKDETKTTAAPSASASAVASAPVSASAPVPSATPPPPATPVHDCPKDSTGLATFSKPCEAKGPARMMEVTWTGKTDEKGPHFRVINKAADVILYGKIAVYFYDKAGKQLEVKDGSGKATPFHTCAGNMFGGVMKAAEKAVLTFSCVKKEHVPEGTAAVEAEMPMVGFADATEKKADWYWRNNDLTPDVRKKGGVKK